MAVPKKKKTRARSNQRRSHHAFSQIHLAKCPECGIMNRPHTVCKNCGTYRGHKVTGNVVEAKLEKAKAEKKAQKETSKK